MATFSISSSYTKLRAVVDGTTNDALPPPSLILKATESLPKTLPTTGLGEPASETHLLEDICPAFNGPKTSSNYYGFVTGGVFPIAEVADNIVTAFDQNPSVHLPDQSVSTIVEDRALSMLVELLGLGDGWEGKTFTTGGTGSNVLGLACGREFVVTSRFKEYDGKIGVGEMGLLAACAEARVKEIQVLTSMGHSSLYKAASVVGIGRASVKDIPFSREEPWRINIELLKQELKRSEEGVVSIVALSAGEINTGRFATDGPTTMKKIRELCDQYGAWLHVDGAFGVFARSLPNTAEFLSLKTSASGLELADSIAGDGHKMLNVPYDCGFFFSRSQAILESVFKNPNAAYLAAEPSPIQSPLNIGLENSRRFRALPVYAALLAYGRDGFAEMYARQVRLARGIAEFLDGSEGYELLASNSSSTVLEEQTKAHEGNQDQPKFSQTHIIVIFRAKDANFNEQLVKKINGTRKIYVSGSKWNGKVACRFAISTWRVDVERDLRLITDVLKSVLKESS